MPAAIGSKAFDPAAHLEKQGWKGKGTALRNGHLTRPLAVVHKKCLGGVGKNRDEQVPFWDNIFAATAASLSLPSSLPSSGTSTPIPSHKLADPRMNKLGSWQTSGSAEASSSHTNKGKGQAGLSIATRVAQENARRGLYSRFFRGEVMRCGPEEEEGEGYGEGAGKEVVASASGSTSTSTGISTPSHTPDTITDTKETKEERRARRAAKAAHKAEKEARKADKAARKEAKAKRKAEKEASRSTSSDIAKAAPNEHSTERVDAAQHASKEGGRDQDEEERRARKKRRREDKKAGEREI